MTTDHIRTGELCPACGEGHLRSHVESEMFEYGGKDGLLETHFSVCDSCGSELAGAAESRLNKRSMNAFKKKVDEKLLGAEILAFRTSFGLSQELAAQLFGGGEVAFSRYENDDIAQSVSMDRLIRLCRTAPINMLRLAELAKIELPDETQTAIRADVAARMAEIAKQAQIEIDLHAIY